MSIKENVYKIKQEIAEAAIRAGRKPDDIVLCAATKMNGAEAVREAIIAGVDCCGENRVQELVQKQSVNAYAGAPVHFIGHLQTNKVRQVVGKVDLIQSVDSLRLLQAVHSEALKQNICQKVLLEINIGAEATKTGFSPKELPQILENLGAYPGVSVNGLMAIPPISRFFDDNRKFFQKMLQLSVDITAKKYDNIRVDILSMGMSGDFREAIACGSTMIRVGTALFGARDYSKL